MNNAFTYFNSNDGTGLFGFGTIDYLEFKVSDDLELIQSFIDKYKSNYIFSNLSFDLKNKVENLTSDNPDNLSFPLATFWIPKTVVKIENGKLSFVQGTDTTENRHRILTFLAKEKESLQINHSTELRPRTSKKDYLEHVNQLKKEIQYGNIYEVNYCQEFYAENYNLIDGEALYFKLNKLTQAPFSSYIRLNNFELFCGSPERFIKKRNSKIISQPIKGTKKRGSSQEEDELLKANLLSDPKERSENVMIVDLVRNDLSKIALKNSVKVDELFGIYSFKTVHQMISTISCEIPKEVNFIAILKALFPMGSMTGAPKISALKLIEKHEEFKRGIYSGAMGYFSPNGDFDFNVVIRTLVYNSSNNYLSCSVGGAITIQSNPEAEYDECFTKIQSILNAINE